MATKIKCLTMNALACSTGLALLLAGCGDGAESQPSAGWKEGFEAGFKAGRTADNSSAVVSSNIVDDHIKAVGGAEAISKASPWRSRRRSESSVRGGVFSTS